MAFTYDAKVASTESSANPRTASLAASASVKLVVITIGCDGGTRSSGTPTYGGSSMTQVGSTVSRGEGSVEQWYIIDPSTGTQTVSVPNTGSDDLVLHAASFECANDVEYDTYGTANRSGTNQYVDVTPLNQPNVLVCSLFGDVNAPPDSSNETELYRTDSGAECTCSSYDITSSTGARTMSWVDANANDYCIIAGVWKEVSSGGVTGSGAAETGAAEISGSGTVTPKVYIYDTGSAPQDYSWQPPAADFTMDSAFPTGPNPTDQYGFVGDAWDGGTENVRELVKFADPDTQIPAGAIITDVELRFYMQSVAGPEGETVYAHRALRDWTVASACWDYYTGTTAWTSGGAAGAGTDIASSASGSVACPAADNWMTISGAGMVDDVQDMLDGVTDNYGWRIYCPTSEDNATNSWARWYSADEITQTTLRPILFVEWTIPASAVETNAVAISGSGTVGTGSVSGSGAAETDAVEIAGDGILSVPGDGAVETSAVAISGTGTSVLYITGSGAAEVSAAEISGDGILSVPGDGAAEAAAVEVGGSGTVANFVTGSGAYEAKTVEIAGDGILSVPGSGAAEAAAVEISGSGLLSVPGSGAAEVAAVEIAGDGILSVPGSGAAEVAAVEVGGTGVVSNFVTGSGAAELAAAEIQGTGTSGAGAVSGSGAYEVAATEIAGDGVLSVPGSGAYEAAAVEVEGDGVVSVPGDGAYETSALALDGSGLLSVPGSGSAETSAVNVAGEGLLSVPGSGAVTTSSVAISGAGTVTDYITGSGAFEVSAVEASGSGTSTGATSFQGLLGLLFHANKGSTGVTGSGAAEAGAAEISGTGTVSNFVTGSGAAETSSTQIAGTGVVTNYITGSGAYEVSSVEIAGSGSVGNGVTGSGAFETGATAFGGTGTVTNYVTGSGAAELSAVEASGAGTSTAGAVTGSGAFEVGAAQVSSSGIPSVPGSGASETGAVALGGTGVVFNYIVAGTGHAWRHGHCGPQGEHTTQHARHKAQEQDKKTT